MKKLVLTIYKDYTNEDEANDEYDKIMQEYGCSWFSETGSENFILVDAEIEDIKN